MSNHTRRQNLGLGKTAAGGSGGSFAAHERGAAAGPPPAAEQPTGVIRDLPATEQRELQQLHAEWQSAVEAQRSFNEAIDMGSNPTISDHMDVITRSRSALTAMTQAFDDRGIILRSRTDTPWSQAHTFHRAEPNTQSA